jgi:hypothetical protein
MKASLVLKILLLNMAGNAVVALAQSPGTFTPTGFMTTPRMWHTATLLTNGKVLIAGGSLDFNPLATAELYDPDSGRFTATGSMTTPRMAHSATLLPDGRVLIAGGNVTAGLGLIPSKSAEIYDPFTGTFTPTGNLISDHVCQQATLLGNGKILIAGGSGLDGRFPQSELYEAATDSFSPTGPYASDHSGNNNCDGAVLTLLTDGRALIIFEEGAAEIYDPGAGSFTPTGNPVGQPYSDGLPRATLLMTGKVLVAGGADDWGVHNTADIFDPSTASFAATGRMSTAHALHTATLLSDGSVLIAGTYAFGGGAFANADVYDPVLGMFRSAGNMTAPRSQHTAALLNDGRVLIAGGNAGAGVSLSLAELYTPSAVVPAAVLLSLSDNRQGQGAILHAGSARSLLRAIRLFLERCWKSTAWA